MNAPVKPQGLGLASIIALIRKEIERAKTEGPKGADGKEGAKGERGAKGDTGPQGKAGPKGGDGKQGKAGKDGKDGKDGEDGVGIEDITQDGDDTIVITMTDGEVYELEMPRGASTEVRYHSSGGGGSSGTVDLAPYVLRPTTKMAGWLAYREDGSKGEWTPLTTDLVAVNPNQFRDAKGRFAPTPKELEGIDNQRDVNEFLYGKIEEVGGEHGDFATKESLANEADMRRTKDEFLQDQIDSNQSQIDQIQEKGYDDTEIRKEIADESLAREKAIEAEKWERSLADIGLRDALQHEIDILKQYSFGELDDKINIESETRRVADEGLQAEINSLAVTLAAESEQREGSDADLQGQIDAISEKGYDDTEIKEGLAAEITAREAGDEDLQSQIDAISEKGYDDTEIKEGLAAEISTREAEDKALQKQIEDEKAERSLADIGLRDSLQAEIDAIEIPSLDGLATEEYVDSAVGAIEFPETDLSEYAKTEYVGSEIEAEKRERSLADIGLRDSLQAEIDAIDVPSIDGLATEEYVDAGDSALQGQIDALEPYDDAGIKQELSKEVAAREEGDANLQNQIDEISEKGYDDTGIREDLAKESEERAEADAALAKQLEDEKTERSLADIGLRDALTAEINAIEIPSLDGYATEEYVDGAIDAIEFPETDLTEYAKTEYVDQGDSALQEQIDALEIPSIDGLATEEWVTGEIEAIEFPETDLSEYAKTEYVDGADKALQDQIDALEPYDDTGIKQGLADEIVARQEADASLQDQIDGIEVPSIDGLATEEWVTGEIDKIEFPETDLSNYYTKQEVNESQQAQDALIAGNTSSIEGEAQARADADAALDAKIDAIEIPSLEGYATEEYVDTAIDGIEFPETDLTDYAKTTYVDTADALLQEQIDALEPYDDAGIKQELADEVAAREAGDANLQGQIDAIEIPSLDGYATEEWVSGQIDAIPDTDLTAYAKTDYVDAADASLQQQIDAIEIPSLEGYATENYVDNAINAIEFPETDLSDYYTKAEVNESQAAQDSKITANEGGIADNAKAIEGEAEAREREDTQLQAEIDQLALALEALLVQREAGQWKYIGFSGDNIPRNPGEFSLISEDLSATENNITINQTDLSDKFHGFGDVTVGDYVEIVDLDKPDEYALFIVDSEPDGTGIVSMNLKLKDKGNNFLIGTTCEIRFFQLNEQDLDLTELDARYLKLTGGTLTGTLKAPRVEAQKLEGGEAMMLIEGKLANNNSAARLTLSNKTNPNAYGSLTWHGQNGEGWFAFNKDLDMNSKGLHSVGRIRLTGEKAICEGSANRILLDNKVVITKPSGNGAGFTVKGKTNGGNNADLLYIYHNSTGLDAVNYAGKQDAPANLANVGYVDNAIANIPEVDLSDYVSKVDGDQTLKGPLTISGVGTWKGSRLFTEFITSENDQKRVQIGTPSNEANLSVYDDKVRVTDVPLQIKVLQEWNPDYGIKYEGAFTEPDHIATKKDVDDLPYLPKSGGELDGQLTIKKSREVALDIVGDGNQSQIKFWSSGAVALQNYTNFKDNELVTKKYVDDAVSTNQGSAGGSLLSHTERLLHTSNGTNGKQFYFWNEHSAPTDAMNYFRRFKWKLPSSHYLSGMSGAGNNVGFLVVQSVAGNLLYQCQINRAEKNNLYIDLHLDHETHYGSAQLAYGSYFIVSLYSCLREA